MRQRLLTKTLGLGGLTGCRRGDCDGRGSARRIPAVGSTEPNPTVVGMQLDFESSLVDHHVMVEPAQDDQFSLIGSPEFCERDEMMDLETMA